MVNDILDAKKQQLWLPSGDMLFDSQKADWTNFVQAKTTLSFDRKTHMDPQKGSASNSIVNVTGAQLFHRPNDKGQLTGLDEP